jgi:peptide-methionine (S)-S-oxide reductase
VENWVKMARKWGDCKGVPTKGTPPSRVGVVRPGRNRHEVDGAGVRRCPLKSVTFCPQMTLYVSETVLTAVSPQGVVIDMYSLSSRASALFIMIILLGVVACNAGERAGTAVPAAVVDATFAAAKGQQTAVISGGCFWGIQAVFQHVKGVINATSGYSGGSADTAQYEIVSGGDTGHAESVKIVYDPSQITYGQLLRVFFSVAHDPTELNRQGPDSGTQYRSSIFYGNDEQKKIAEAYIAQLDKAKVFPHPIVTQVVPLRGFYPAEAYHQDYAAHHPDNPYIVFNDAPKVVNLQRQFPDLYTGK